MPKTILGSTKYAKGLSFPSNFCGHELVCHELGSPEKCGVIKLKDRSVLWVLTNIGGKLNLRFMTEGHGLGHQVTFYVLPENLEEVILDLIGSMFLGYEST